MSQPKKSAVNKGVKNLNVLRTKDAGVTYYLYNPNPEPDPPTPSEPPLISYDDLDANRSPKDKKIIREKED